MTVRTTGINWESYSAIVGTVVALLGLILAWTSKRQSDLQRDIAKAVNNQTELLLAKLETKDNVASLRLEMAQLSAKVEYAMRSERGDL